MKKTKNQNWYKIFYSSNNSVFKEICVDSDNLMIRFVKYAFNNGAKVVRIEKIEKQCKT